MRWTPAGGTRRRGRPKKTWKKAFQEGLEVERVHLTWNEAEVMASDRSYWRQAAAQCALRHGRGNGDDTLRCIRCNQTFKTSTIDQPNGTIFVRVSGIRLPVSGTSE